MVGNSSQYDWQYKCRVTCYTFSRSHYSGNSENKSEISRAHDLTRQITIPGTTQPRHPAAKTPALQIKKPRQAGLSYQS